MEERRRMPLDAFRAFGHCIVFHRNEKNLNIHVRVRGVRSVAPKYLLLQAHDHDREKVTVKGEL